MKKALVTGATSGIGLEIAKKLVDMGYVVYGVGRDFSKVDFKNENFKLVVCDLIKYQNIEEMVRKLEDKEEIELLVNCAGVGYFAPHEEINPSKLHKMIALNLEAPLILTQQLLRHIKKNQGTIINIASITAKKSSVFGCGYSATKAGLGHFSESLFDEVRKTGVKVVCIYPDITKTPFYDNLNFREGDDKLSYILPECVASSVEMILSQREGTVITQLVVQPQKHMIKKK